MKPTLRAALLGAMLVGCGGGPAHLPHTKSGSFLMIEGAVADIVSTISSPTYKPTSRDLGTDSDRLGFALITLTRQTEGTALGAAAQELKSKFQALEKLVAARAPLDQQRAAAKALQAAVELVKAKS